MKLSCMWYAIHTQKKPSTAPTIPNPNAPGPSSRSYPPQAQAQDQLITTRSCDTVLRTPKGLKVCYSMHPSLAEAVAVIDYLKPKIVTPL